MDPSPPEPASTKLPNGNVPLKLVALMLMLGGVVGAVLFVVGVVVQLSQRSPAALLTLIGLLVFLWTIFKGYDLWRKVPAGYKWARILFAAQIPIINVPGFLYWFYTGLAVSLTHQSATIGGAGFTKLGVYFHLGSELNVWIGAQHFSFVLGINPLALVILIYLSRLKPPDAQHLPAGFNPTSQDTPLPQS